MPLKFQINILDSLETTRFSTTLQFWPFFSSFFSITFDWKEKFKSVGSIGRIQLKHIKLNSILTSKDTFVSIKINFQVRKCNFIGFFFAIVFSNYFQSSLILYIPIVASERITPSSIITYLFFHKKKLKLIKNRFF